MDASRSCRILLAATLAFAFSAPFGALANPAVTPLPAAGGICRSDSGAYTAYFDSVLSGNLVGKVVQVSTDQVVYGLCPEDQGQTAIAGTATFRVTSQTANDFAGFRFSITGPGVDKAKKASELREAYPIKIKIKKR